MTSANKNNDDRISSTPATATMLRTDGIAEAHKTDANLRISLEIASAIREEVSRSVNHSGAGRLREEASRSCNDSVMGRLPYPFFYNIKQIIAGMRNNERHAPIAVSVKGASLEVAYSGPLPLSPNITYPSSNEKFDWHTFKVMGKISGTTRFLGIVGGFNYPLSVVLNLQQRNRIETFTFVDYDQNQCFNAILMAMRLDMHLSNSADMNAFDPQLFLKKERPRKFMPAKLNFRSGDMMHEIISANEKGKYFIYLSNAYAIQDSCTIVISGHANRFITTDLLRAVLKNENIEQGSHVLFVRASSSEFVMLRKEHYDFSVTYFHCAEREGKKKALQAYLRMV